MKLNSRGKKFDAAQKHFQEKEIVYRQKVRRLESENTCLTKLVSVLEEQNDSLENENAKLKEWVEKLLECTEMSKDDIKNVCKTSKVLSDMSILSNSLTQFMY